MAKKEFETFYNSQPEVFEVKGPDGMPIAESVPCEPSLVITRSAVGKKMLEEGQA